jgi:drug/metabolite transporter (DMT)-like permease
VRLRALIPALAAPLALGVVHLVEKLAIQQGVPAAPFALGQTAVAFLVLWPIWLWKRRERNLTLVRSGRLRSLALIGVLASGVVVLLGITALGYTSATHKGVIQATYPVGTMLFAWLLLRERITVSGYVAAAVIVAGLVLMTSRGFRGAPNMGDWILIATVPVMGFADAYAKKVLADVPPVTVSLGRFLFGTAILVVLTLVTELGPLSALLPVWELLLAAGVLTALSMGLFYLAIHRAGPSLAAGLLAAAPVVTVTLETWLLDERFLVVQLLGVGLVLAGVAQLSRAHRVSSNRTDSDVAAAAERPRVSAYRR